MHISRKYLSCILFLLHTSSTTRDVMTTHKLRKFDGILKWLHALYWYVRQDNKVSLWTYNIIVYNIIKEKVQLCHKNYFILIGAPSLIDYCSKCIFSYKT